MISATNYQYKKINFTNSQTSSQKYEEKSTLRPAVCSFIQPGIGQMIQGDKSKAIKHGVDSIIIPVLGWVTVAGIGKLFKKDLSLGLAAEACSLLAVLTRIHSVLDVLNPNTSND